MPVIPLGLIGSSVTLQYRSLSVIPLMVFGWPPWPVFHWSCRSSLRNDSAISPISFPGSSTLDSLLRCFLHRGRRQQGLQTQTDGQRIWSLNFLQSMGDQLWWLPLIPVGFTINNRLRKPVNSRQRKPILNGYYVFNRQDGCQLQIKILAPLRRC